MSQHTMRPGWAIALAVFAGIFGLLTLKSGGEVLFVDGVGRKAAGNYVPFVVWFNFFAGIAYLVAALGLFLWKPWVEKLALTIAALTLIVFAAFGLHIFMDGLYENRTIGAMTLRSIVWLGIAFAVRGKFQSRVPL